MFKMIVIVKYKTVTCGKMLTIKFFVCFKNYRTYQGCRGSGCVKKNLNHILSSYDKKLTKIKFNTSNFWGTLI